MPEPVTPEERRRREEEASARDNAAADEQSSDNFISRTGSWLWDNTIGNFFSFGNFAFFGVVAVAIGAFWGPIKNMLPESIRNQEWFRTLDGFVVNGQAMVNNFFKEQGWGEPFPEAASQAWQSITPEQATERAGLTGEAATQMQALMPEITRTMSGAGIAPMQFMSAEGLSALITRNPSLAMRLIDTLPAAGAEGAAMPDGIKRAVTGITGSQTTFRTLMQNPQSRAVLLAAMQKFAAPGSVPPSDALETFITSTGLDADPEPLRVLVDKIVKGEDATQAMAALIAGRPPEAIAALVQAWPNAPTSVQALRDPEVAAAASAAAQAGGGAAFNNPAFTALMETPQGAAAITALVRALRATNRENPEQPVNQLMALFANGTPSASAIDAYVKNADGTYHEGRRQALLTFARAVQPVASDEMKPQLTQVIQLLSMNAERSAAVARAADSVQADPALTRVLGSLSENIQRYGITAVTGFMFNDNARSVLISDTALNAAATMITASRSDLGLPAGMFDNEAQAKNNLNAAMLLIASIDGATGTEAGHNEREADIRNSKVVSFMLRAMQGERFTASGSGADRMFTIGDGTQAITVSARAIANMMGTRDGNDRHTVAAAFREFLNTVDISANSPYREVFNLFKNGFWNDADRDGKVEFTGALGSKTQAEGLAAVFMDKDIASTVLARMAGASMGAQDVINRGLMDAPFTGEDTYGRLLQLQNAAERARSRNS